MTEQHSPQGSAEQFVQNVAQLVGAFGRGPQQDLRPEQQHLILQFRALRNGLGNFGRHGETPDKAILASPEISPGHSRGNGYTLTFVEPLPRGTASILLRYPRREAVYPVSDVDDEYWELPISDPEVTSVEVWDVHGEPLAVGIPHFHDKGKKRSRQLTTVTGRPIESSPAADSSSPATSATAKA
jgi:hypothetical protein